MKFVVLSLSGNVGKTTVTVHLIKPRVPNATLYSVETINEDAGSDGIEVEKIKGKRYGQLIDTIITESDAIVDVGASNVEDFLRYMQQFEGSHEEFDYFIIPCIKDRKPLNDTINTTSKVKVIFNRVNSEEDVIDEFAPIIGYLKENPVCDLNLNLFIRENEVYERIKGMGKTITDIFEDDTDYRAKIVKAKDDEKDHLVRMIALKRLAISAKKNLDDVFTSLINEQ